MCRRTNQSIQSRPTPKTWVTGLKKLKRERDSLRLKNHKKAEIVITPKTQG